MIFAFDSQSNTARLAWASSIALHALLVVALLYASKQLIQAPPALQAELWDLQGLAVSPAAQEVTDLAVTTPAKSLPVERTTLPKLDAVALDDKDIAIQANRKLQKANLDRIEASKIKLEAEKKAKDLALQKQTAADAEKAKKELQTKKAAAVVAQAKQAAEKQASQQAAKDAAEQAKRTARLNQLAGKSGAPTVGATQAGDTSSMSKAYEAKLQACIKPFMRFSDIGVTNNPRVEWLLKLSTDGKPLTTNMTRSSGLPAFDNAVERAIYQCDPFPRPDTGAYPSQIKLGYSLKN